MAPPRITRRLMSVVQIAPFDKGVELIAMVDGSVYARQIRRDITHRTGKLIFLPTLPWRKLREATRR